MWINRDNDKWQKFLVDREHEAVDVRAERDDGEVDHWVIACVSVSIVRLSLGSS